MRIYAVEFLFDLGDPRSVSPALNMAKKTTDDERRYELIFVVSNSIARCRRLNAPRRARLFALCRASRTPGRRPKC
ncbi:MAG: hypothetical protein AB7O88_18110 [Reyranellaceae bacterium]